MERRVEVTEFDPRFEAGAITRTEVPGAGAVLRRVQVAAGTSSPRHSHPYEQFVMVVTGGGTLDCELGPVKLRPGTTLRFAPGAWHSAEFTSDTVLVEVNLAQAG